MFASRALLLVGHSWDKPPCLPRRVQAGVGGDPREQLGEARLGGMIEPVGGLAEWRRIKEARLSEGLVQWGWEGATRRETVEKSRAKATATQR